MSALLRRFPALLLIGLSSCIIVVDDEDLGDFDHTETFTDRITIGDAVELRVEAEEGDLEILGRDDLDRIRVTGRAAASNRRDLDEIDLDVYRDGDRIRVEADVPEGLFHRARLDLVIEVPDDFPVRVFAEDGDLVIDRTGPVDIEDGSGNITVHDILGDVRIDDGSGEIEVRTVAGEVWIRDNSGNIGVFDVEDDVTIDDDESGNITIAGVGGDVLILDDSSGNVDVSDVTGDFTVERKGSGSIRHRNIGGVVRLPR